MGTPDFAVTILDKLVSEKYDIAGVVTAPDKPSGRGQKVHESAVKAYAKEAGLLILQPTNLKDASFLSALAGLNADVFVVVAFRMLPESVWSMPSKGTINLHASLLPNYRGAAPINWAVINGETETGVTSFFIEKEIDTGKIIQQEKVAIAPDETAGELYTKLMYLGAEVIHSTLQSVASGKIDPVDQKSMTTHDLKAAPKIFKQDCEIDFTRNAIDVHNFCRGLSPYPAAWCNLTDKSKQETKMYKIFGTKVTQDRIVSPYQILSSKQGLLFPCSDYYILVQEIQPEGKRRMDHKAFSAGNPVENLIIS
jgi:methionyl-tRNA formyltransferase